MKNSPLSLGFTLVEVAIALALITVLTLVVFPVYSSYTKKSQVEEALVLVANTEIAVDRAATSNAPLASLWTPPIKTEAIENITVYLTDTTGISLSSHGNFIDNLPSHHSGEIVIAFSKKVAPANQNELVLSPRFIDLSESTSNGHNVPLDFSHQLDNVKNIIWECNSASPPPLNRGTHGNIDAKLVPVDCHA